MDVDETGLFGDWQDQRRDIRLRDLLRMTSGLAFEEVYAPGADATRMLFNAHSAAAIPRAKALEFPVGTHFAYSSGTTNLLSLLYFERVGGTPQASYTFLQQRLLQPLGMAQTVFEADPSGVLVGSSYLYASAEDWARLGRLLLDNGKVGERTLLSESFVAQLQAPNDSSNDQRYGYQVWLNAASSEQPRRWPDLPASAYAMQGNRAQVVMMLPDANAVVVRLGWSSGSYPTNERMASIRRLLVPLRAQAPGAGNGLRAAPRRDPATS